MRTIKFRGKSPSGEWLYGYLYKHGITPPSNILCIGPAVLPWKDTVGVYVVDPDTIGQYTGLTDKTGREIYEGDIILYHGIKRVVEYEYAEFGLSMHKNGFPFEALCKLIEPMHHYKVIGNIHDNPELLEKGGEQ